MISFVAIFMISLHGLDGRVIFVNTEEITSLHGRVPGKSNAQFADGVNCLVHLTDGKHVSVVETCGAVRDAIARVQNGGPK